MDSKFDFLRRQSTGVTFFVVGALGLIIGCGILASHAGLFSQKRDTAVMIGTQMPALTSSVNLLEASVEAERYYADQALQSREEQASVFVLPEGSPVSRVVAMIQETAIALKPMQPVTIDRLTFGSMTDSGSVKVTPVHLELRGSYQGVASLLGVASFGGRMMVRDMIPVDTQQTFLAATEAANPLALKGAEAFLYLDLLEYAAHPDASESSALKDIPVDAMADIRVLLLQNGLAHVRTILAPVASHLRDKNLWPLPLTAIRSLSRDGDKWTIELVAFSR